MSDMFPEGSEFIIGCQVAFVTGLIFLFGLVVGLLIGIAI